MRLLPDKVYLQLLYRYHIGKWINLKSPKGFNEKIQWLKLYDRRPEYTTMVDKLLAKEYVGNIIGQEHIIPTLAVWDDPKEINFDALPDQFVIKCNHDSHSVVICRDKSAFDREAAIKKLAARFKQNAYWQGRAYPYKNIRKKVFAEKYMEDESGYELKDYKFFCYDGVMKYLKIDFDRFTQHRSNYYDRHGNLMSIGETVCPPDPSRVFAMPENLNTMIEYAEKLSRGIPFLRVDFYNVNGKIYFGELTFYPASGFGKFTSEEGNLALGEKLKLPEVRRH